MNFIVMKEMGWFDYCVRLKFGMHGWLMNFWGDADDGTR